RLARSKFGQVEVGDVEYVYRSNSTGWFAIKAADDGSTWLLSASQEDSVGVDALDKAAHLYAVTDNGATVWEVAAMPAETSSFTAVAPVGASDMGGDLFWLRTHAVPHTRRTQWRCRVARGAIKE